MKDFNVLVIDDEKICIEEVQTEVKWAKLDIDPVRVYGAGSVRQAEIFLKSTPVQIVICDIEMPNENGLDFIEWISEWVRFSGDPVECIMLTCHPEYQYVRRALQLGCLDYVLKPMEPEELEAALTKAVEKIESRREKNERLEKTQVQDTHEDIVYDKILPYIKEYLSESLSVELIAEHAALNPQYMMRMFKKKTGKSILSYVSEQRIALAKEMLLKTDWSLEVITEKIGYISPAHFGALFKRMEGISPGQYRKKYR